MTEKNSKVADITARMSELDQERAALLAANQRARDNRQKAQLTIGEVIAKLDAIAKKTPDALVAWGADLESAHHIHPARFRELSLGIGGWIEGKKPGDWMPQFTTITLLDRLSDMINNHEVMQGWKGNEYIYEMSTFVYLDNYGSYSGERALVEVELVDGQVLFIEDDLDGDAA